MHVEVKAKVHFLLVLAPFVQKSLSSIDFLWHLCSFNLDQLTTPISPVMELMYIFVFLLLSKSENFGKLTWW
jgi:hypothetical protein